MSTSCSPMTSISLPTHRDTATTRSHPPCAWAAFRALSSAVKPAQSMKVTPVRSRASRGPLAQIIQVSRSCKQGPDSISSSPPTATVIVGDTEQTRVSSRTSDPPCRVCQPSPRARAFRQAYVVRAGPRPADPAGRCCSRRPEPRAADARRAGRGPDGAAGIRGWASSPHVRVTRTAGPDRGCGWAGSWPGAGLRSPGRRASPMVRSSRITPQRPSHTTATTATQVRTMRAPQSRHAQACTPAPWGLGLWHSPGTSA